MSAPSRRPLLIGLFVVVLLFHLSVLWQDFATLAKNGYLYDDSFYAFKIAQNIASGHGATFDGVHPTNGFQPLYVFLLVPLFWLFGSNLVAPIYAAKTEVGLKFTEIRLKDGLPAALKWRREQFAAYE